MNDKITKRPSFLSTEFNNPITEFALAITAVDDDNYYPSGTAIIIAPYLAITAGHVIDDFFKQYEGHNLKSNSKNNKATFDIQVIQLFDNGKNGRVWYVRKIWRCNYTDIAVLHLIPSDNEIRKDKLRLIKLDLYPPKIGDKIFAFGYRAPSIEFDNNFLNWKVDPITTNGIVKDVHYDKRDNCRLSFPCFQTNARFDGSMSGGPVFNSKGKLCGIICSNLPPDTEDDEHVSYVTMLWPMMSSVIDVNREGFPLNTAYPILDLAKDGFIDAEGWENIKLIVNPDNNTRKIYFQIPKKML